jgi:hypothetical protein
MFMGVDMGEGDIMDIMEAWAAFTAATMAVERAFMKAIGAGTSMVMKATMSSPLKDRAHIARLGSSLRACADLKNDN